MLLPHLNVFWSLNKFWEYAEGEWSRKNLMKILIFRGRSAQKCSAPQNVLRQKMSLRLSCSLSPTNVGSAKLFPTFKSLNVILKFYTTRLWFEKSHSTHMFPSRTSLLTSLHTQAFLVGCVCLFSPPWTGMGRFHMCSLEGLELTQFGSNLCHFKYISKSFFLKQSDRCYVGSAVSGTINNKARYATQQNRVKGLLSRSRIRPRMR